MNDHELFESQAVIRSEWGKERIEAQIAQQEREVGRKLIELLRQSPTCFVSLHITRERADHLEPDPMRQPPDIQRMALDIVSVEDGYTINVERLERHLNHVLRSRYRREQRLKQNSRVPAPALARS